jgi:hypothetical protein
VSKERGPLIRDVLWIGGTPGSGKTTIATLLARRHGLRLYSADTRTWEHRDRALREGHPAAHRWEGMTPEERWETSSPADMLAMSLHSEREHMIVDDLRALPASPVIVAEGSPLPPHAVSSGIADRSRAVWLIPTPQFHRAQLEKSCLARGRRELSLRLAAEIERETKEHAAPTLTVNGSRGIDETVAAVEERFADALAAGPHADTVADRRALLREGNAAIVAQVRGYYARPWAEGDADSVVRAFGCECGAKDCAGTVDLTVGAFATRPVLSPGHG